MKTAIFGAAGQIGARLTQAMLLDGEQLRAISRKKSPRIARWNNIEFHSAELPVQGSALNELLSGCDAVVNLVVDHKPYGSDAASIESNVRALREMLETAIRLNVKKFIHASTISVLPPLLSSPVKHYEYSSETDWYTRVKIATEKVALEYKNSIDLCVLRPGIVYGPYLHWSKFAFMQTQKFCLIIPHVEQSVCHAIHVDDLNSLIRHLLAYPGKLPELVYGINPEIVTWKNFYELHANALGLYDDITNYQSRDQILDYLKQQKQLENGPGKAERLLERIRALYGKMPSFVSGNPVSRKSVEVMKVLKRGLHFYTQLYIPPPKARSYPGEFETDLYSCTAEFTPDLTGGEQGFSYAIPFKTGVKNAAAWWNFHAV